MGQPGNQRLRCLAVIQHAGDHRITEVKKDFVPFSGGIRDGIEGSSVCINASSFAARLLLSAEEVMYTPSSIRITRIPAAVRCIVAISLFG